MVGFCFGLCAGGAAVFLVDGRFNYAALCLLVLIFCLGVYLNERDSGGVEVTR
jgi:hypothetical protein